MPSAQEKTRYVAALDGLRALSIVGVVLYHMGFSWMGGGLLGVTILFVLSGYLVTSGLVAEYEKHGKIRLGDFFVRRIHRVYPSIIIFIVVTAAACVIFSHVLLTKMRPDIVPSFFMLLNWAKILGNESYFAAAGAPSPLTHFWSLAIEFQFYLVWPPILYLLLSRKVSKDYIRNGLLVAALISAILLAFTYTPGVDPSRPYYGTDTRALSLFLGAALALVWPHTKMGAIQARDLQGPEALIVAIGGPCAIAALVLLMIVTKGYTSFSYYGGIVLVSIISAVAVTALVPEGSVGSAIMSLPPLEWIGKRSFALYLWHYPILEFLSPANSTSARPWWLYVLEMVLSLVAADLSYRFVEQSCRKEGIVVLLRSLADSLFAPGTSEPEAGETRAAASRSRAASSELEIMAADSYEERDRRSRGRDTSAQSARMRAGSSRRGARDSHVSRDTRNTRSGRSLDPSSFIPRLPAIAAIVLTLTAVLGLAFVPPVSAAGDTEATKVSAATLKKPLKDGVYDVVIIGDSVPLVARDQVAEAFPYALIDAEVNRQCSVGAEIYQDYNEQSVVGDTVVFALGTNGIVDDAMLDNIVATVGSEKQIWFVNNRAPDPWIPENNQVFARCVDKYDNVHLIDWHAASDSHDEWFVADGTHPVEEGSIAFANTMVQTMGYEPPTKENTTYSHVVVGDGIAISAADALAAAFPQGVVDCAQGRTPSQAAELIQKYVDDGVVGGPIVASIANEAPITKADIEKLVQAAGEHELLLVNTRVPEAWDVDNNKILASVASTHDTVRVVDWYAASTNHDSYLQEDGAHLTQEGAEAYAKLINS